MKLNLQRVGLFTLSVAASAMFGCSVSHVDTVDPKPFVLIENKQPSTLYAVSVEREHFLPPMPSSYVIFFADAAPDQMSDREVLDRMKQVDYARSVHTCKRDLFEEVMNLKPDQADVGELWIISTSPLVVAVGENGGFKRSFWGADLRAFDAGLSSHGLQMGDAVSFVRPMDLDQPVCALWIRPDNTGDHVQRIALPPSTHLSDVFQMRSKAELK